MLDLVKVRKQQRTAHAAEVGQRFNVPLATVKAVYFWMVGSFEVCAHATELAEGAMHEFQTDEDPEDEFFFELAALFDFE